MSQYKDPKKNRKYMREYMRARRKKGTLSWEKGYYKKLKKRALLALGGPVCAGCACTVERILEVNHINGGGQRERKVSSSAQILQKIVSGRAKAGEFNVLCRVCNAAHYVEKILRVAGHAVSWKPVVTRFA